MSEAQRRARAQERVEELCAACVRALSGVRDLHYRGGRLHRGRAALPLHAPHLRPALDSDDFASFRGAADGYGLRLANSDARLHRALCPADAVERMVFELLEQFRSEAGVPPGMPGVRRNLRHRFEAWSLTFHHGGGTDDAPGLLMYTVAQVCRAKVTGDPLVEETEDLLEATRAGISPLVGHELAGLRRDRADQAAYAVHALRLATTIAAMLRERSEETAPDEHVLPERAYTDFRLLADGGQESDDASARAGGGARRSLGGTASRYRIFSTAYDREDHAATLVRPAELTGLRERLDRRIAELAVNRHQLVRELRALLARPAQDGWDSAQEEGLVDGRRLAQLIASPTERRLFRLEREQPRADCLVTLLIDCSGSMREHIESVAVLADLLARALEEAGAASEVLGFTTGAWNGGRARRDWLRAGRPDHPGRLNESSHLVFKNAATPWRRARLGIAALCKGELFREGIDGEAVEWAMRRGGEREEHRRLLIVVSDGSPMDSATSLANGPGYLDRHLMDVVARHESLGSEIYGVGVGLDLSPYYSRSHVLDLGAPVGMALFRELLAMIGRGPRR